MRETAAQALGAAARALPDSALPVLARHLCVLAGRKEWEARLGGLLGLKYLLAARSDAAAALLPRVLPAAQLGLQVWPSQCLAGVLFESPNIPKCPLISQAVLPLM